MVSTFFANLQNMYRSHLYLNIKLYENCIINIKLMWKIRKKYLNPKDWSYYFEVFLH